ncbi:MIP/aquaporin family protein [Myceligenerans pegani]|uniref:Aquaporin family protein n=1 Tax=Myceligenerans pegani TaxID=2776917 RepID=A0ABR9MWJ8_9MICO|nr:MIP/aquaporin family protein [Myceligenerans sp. TRM 65318]MBE1875774.1 aquaporin family protein [Myceligenerans sp. TRM 65318]MBE3018045.1 aquaporin family protein [Myceligenerans sp. TRM 65318]
MSTIQLFVTEMLGTMMLTLLGCSVVANAILPRTKGAGVGASWLLINFGWGLAVFSGVFVAFKSGAHINPAVTVGLLASGSDELGPGIAATAGNAAIYIAGQMAGAFLGAVLTYLAHKRHFDEEAPGAVKLAVFSTGPEIRSYGWNVVTEIIGTFVLVFVVLSFANWPGDLGPLAVALLVTGIGASLGGPTGYAINPARDLGPRIAHAILPIRGKGGSDWAYSWVPVVGPLIGGALGGALAPAVAF